MAVESKLARYRVVTTLGRGGMASVVLAEDTTLGRQVALKRMHPSAADPGGLLRLRREALVGASLSHRNLVSIYDVIDSEDGDAVIVMEYVEGETLRDTLTREGGLVPREALRVLKGVAAALDAIHARGIVHRDVKPANVLLGVDGDVKLADLGIASVPDDTRITTAGTVLGSFRYMAPEQLREGPATRAIDVYALATVAFEALCGHPAHREAHALAVAHAIATRPPPDLREVWPAAPAAAAEVLMCGMCRDPAGRPASAGDLASRLEAALEPEGEAPVQRGGRLRPQRAAPGARAVDEPKAEMRRARTGGTGQRPNPSGTRISLPSRSTSAASPGSNGDRVPRVASGSRPGPVSRKAFIARRRAPWGRVVAALALVFAAGGLLLTFLSDGARTPSSNQARSRGRATETQAARSSSAAASATTHTHTGAAASATTNTPAGAASASAHRPGSTPQTTGTSSSRGASPAPTRAAESRSSAAAPTVPAPTTPVAAVQAFYGLAAGHRYNEAWALADPTFRSQLRGFLSFQAGQAADRSITFHIARIIRQSSDSATVYVRTTSVRTSGSEECAGTVDVVRADPSAGWLLHTIDINCS